MASTTHTVLLSLKPVSRAEGYLSSVSDMQCDHDYAVSPGFHREMGQFATLRLIVTKRRGDGTINHDSDIIFNEKVPTFLRRGFVHNLLSVDSTDARHYI